MKRIGKLYSKTLLDGLHWEINKLRNHELITVHTDTDRIVIKDMQNHSVTPDEPLELVSKWVRFHTDGENSVKFGTTEVTFDYSYDGKNWIEWDSPAQLLPFGGSYGDLYIRGNNPNGFNYSNSFSFSSDTDLVDIEGNSTYLLNSESGTDIIPENGFAYLFYNCKSLRSVSKDFLPATTIGYQGYSEMFSECTSLINVPELPATTLSGWCYQQMFNGCSSLVNAPKLPATTLTEACYGGMFTNCTLLSGAPELPATTLANYCYQSMFEGCTSLVNAPVLPATTLVEGCYGSMFSGCTLLNEIKCYATNISADWCLSSWLENVASTGTLRVPSSMVGQYPSGASGIPEGWTYEAVD